MATNPHPSPLPFGKGEGEAQPGLGSIHHLVTVRRVEWRTPSPHSDGERAGVRGACCCIITSQRQEVRVTLKPRIHCWVAGGPNESGASPVPRQPPHSKRALDPSGALVRTIASWSAVSEGRGHTPLWEASGRRVRTCIQSGACPFPPTHRTPKWRSILRERSSTPARLGVRWVRGEGTHRFGRAGLLAQQGTVKPGNGLADGNGRNLRLGGVCSWCARVEPQGYRGEGREVDGEGTTLELAWFAEWSPA